QTCALPISAWRSPLERVELSEECPIESENALLERPMLVELSLRLVQPATSESARAAARSFTGCLRGRERAAAEAYRARAVRATPSGLAIDRPARAHCVEPREVARRDRVALRKRRARLAAERLEPARILVVGDESEKGERGQEAGRSRGERSEELGALVRRERGELRSAALGEQRPPGLETRPEYRAQLRLLGDAAQQHGRETQRAGAGQAAVRARRQ